MSDVTVLEKPDPDDAQEVHEPAGEQDPEAGEAAGDGGEQAAGDEAAGDGGEPASAE